MSGVVTMEIGDRVYGVKSGYCDRSKFSIKYYAGGSCGVRWGACDFIPTHFHTFEAIQYTHIHTTQGREHSKSLG